MKCEIVTGNMPQLWEDLLSQLHEKEYPSESIRHYREAMGRVDRYMRENQILEYTEAVGETYLATHGGRISSGRQFYMSFYVRRLNDILNKRPYAQSRSFDAACCFRKDINKIPAKKQGQPTRTAFSLNEVKLLLSLPDTKSKIGLRDRTLLSVMYASGARAQEMCNLTVADVRFDKETATLTLKGKGGKYRHIGIPTAPAKILKQYIVFREIDRCFDKFVFPSQTHAQMTVSCVEGIFKKYVSLARKRHPNLFRAKSYSPHSMRHSTATHMLEAGVPLIVIKNFLGHSSLQTTQVYAAVSQCTLNKHIQDWNKKWFSDDGSLEHQLKAEIPSFLI